jgi:FlaA1/EpsC-like NDP-sugar epimerase
MLVFHLNQQLLKLRNRHFFVGDTLTFLLTPLLAIALHFDGLQAIIPYFPSLFAATLLFTSIKLVLFYHCGVYRRYWRYASIDELGQIAWLTVAATGLQTLGLILLNPLWSAPLLPPSISLIDGLLSLLIVGGLRFSVRTSERACESSPRSSQRQRTLIVGAGSGGIAIVQEMQRHPGLGLNPIAFIDDDADKLHLNIRGIPVVGDRDRIPDTVNTLDIQRIVIAMPSVAGEIIRDIHEICQTTDAKTSTLPGIHEILNGRVNVSSVRDVKIEDLLRREPIQTDIQRVRQFIHDKKVLVTGAGGSIGSELCRQIFKCRPAEIILLGHGENSIFGIHQELEQLIQTLRDGGTPAEKLPKLHAFIADLRLRDRLDYGFKHYRPDIVFHAAAHKHVPMMEFNPSEAITNNVLGSKNLIELAQRYDVKQFVMISTDKAINPTSIMGASKRTAELLVLQAAKTTGKPFVVVRFGNVLGSRGSVVRTFQKQIAAGGPVTITHPDICRYFMTIPEAVQLVLQACVLSRGGEVFMLNMGHPVKIADLAKDLIRLSGYEVGRDIQVKYTGLRPGEKLFEELLIPGEAYNPTEHEKLLVVNNASEMVPHNLTAIVKTLGHAAQSHHTHTIVHWLKQLTGYTPTTSPIEPLPATSDRSAVRQPLSAIGQPLSAS